MFFSVLTIFPELISPFLDTGMMRQARLKGLIRSDVVNIRDYAEGRHRVTDDKPYGGGCGMVMKPEPLVHAIDAAKAVCPEAWVVMLSPQGRTFSQAVVREYASLDGLIFVCGRYEGIDERVVSGYVDEEISIGDYVLTGGELGAMVIMDSVIRLIPGVLGGESSAEKETFENGLVEHAQYTRPEVFNGDAVPPVLLSGNHGAIEKWRMETALKRTFLKRPDLLESRVFTADEVTIIRKWCRDLETLVAP